MGKKNEEYEIEYEFEKKKGKALPITIVLIVTIGLIVFFILNKESFLDGFKETEDLGVKETEMVVNKNFVTGLRLASIDRYDEAISYFEKMNFNKMSESDQEIVLMTYLKNGDEQKALDLDESIAEEIVKKYLENNEMEKLNKLATNSKVIEFEMAILENDYNKIIELKDDVNKNSRRGNAIANAYYQIGETEEAVNYTSLMVLDGINMWQSDGKIKTSEIDISKENSSNNKSLYVVGIVIFILILLITFIGLSVLFKRYYFGQKTKEKDFKRIKKEKISQEVVEEDSVEEKEDDRYSYYYDDE